MDGSWARGRTIDVVAAATRPTPPRQMLHKRSTFVAAASMRLGPPRQPPHGRLVDSTQARSFGDGLTVREAGSALQAWKDERRHLTISALCDLSTRQGLGLFLHGLVASGPLPWDLECIKLLLACGADVNAQFAGLLSHGMTTLQKRLLVPFHRDVATRRQSTFLTRIVCEVYKLRRLVDADGVIDVVKMALDAGADLDLCGPLFYAIAANYHVEHDGFIPAHHNEFALIRFKIASLLVERGADVGRAERLYLSMNDADALYELGQPDVMPFVELLSEPHVSRWPPGHQPVIARLRALIVDAQANNLGPV